MREPKIIQYPNVKVIIRKDFYSKFESQLKKIVEDTGAIYFGHNIIKDYGTPNHRVSNFCSHEAWQETYWEKYRNEDPTEKVCHEAAQKNSLGIVSWSIGNHSGSCAQERRKMTDAKDGIFFSFKKPDNYLETILVGWKDLDLETLDIDYITHLTSLLKPVRDYHWEVHEQVA